MENKFISIRTDRGIYVHINTNYIELIISKSQGCEIYVVGSEHPYTITVSADEIIKKINEKQNGK